MDRGAPWATAHRVAESDMTEATQHTHAVEWFCWVVSLMHQVLHYEQVMWTEREGKVVFGVSSRPAPALRNEATERSNPG